MSNLLYYPHINLPNSDWTIRAILYYENIGSIIPEQYFYEPEHFEPFMREALRNELIEFINPINALDNPGHISDVFLTYLTNTPRIIDRRREDFACNNKARSHSGKFANKNSRTRIHAGKFDTNILLELTNMRLAVEGDDNWYYVENRTANELMTYLASVVANNINYIPATDRMDYHGFKSTYINNQNLEVHIRQYKRDLILKELIPYPEEIELNNLRRFKDEHFDLLKRFNNRVELITLDPSITPESQLFQATLDNMRAEKEELSARMNESRFGKIVCGSICGTISAGIAFLQEPALGAGLALINAIHAARQIERPEDIYDQTGLKYLALVDKRLRRYR